MYDWRADSARDGLLTDILISDIYSQFVAARV